MKPVKNKKIGIIEFCVSIGLLFIIIQAWSRSYLFAQGAALATGTPDIYNVTMKKFEASQDNGTTYVTVADTEMTFNIASVGAGQKVADWVSGAQIPVGTYNRVRHTVSSTFVIEGYVYYDGTNRTYYTTSSGVASVAGNVTDTGLMPSYGPQPIAVPAGGECSGGSCVTTESQSFTITEGSSLRKRIRFNVTGRLALYEEGPSNYVLYPQQPLVDSTDI